jgi:hypothetical protein
MPRTSRAALSIVANNDNPQRPLLKPMQSLTKAQLKVFNYTIRTNPHLQAADVPLLELYSIAYCRAIAAKQRTEQRWDSEARTMIALATKLKITPASQPRRKPDGRSSYYDRMQVEEEAS